MINELKSIIHESNNIVFLGGAGVSTESNIPDFRSAEGLYNNKEIYPPEVILSHSFFMQHPDLFYSFYKSKMIYKDAKPNNAHLALTKLEEAGELKAVITQNIDGLHQLGGSKNVLELHGSVHRNHCMKCNTAYSLEDVINSEEIIPYCTECGGIIKPDVVLYEEPLDTLTLQKSIHYISNADVLIVGGTSLVVYPAAGLINYYNGKHLILINKSSTPYDHQADYVIHESIGEVLRQLVEDIK